METFRDRVEAEKKELAERLEKLVAFLKGKDKRRLSFQSQGLLKRQAEVMTEYLEILEERCSEWAGK